MRGVLRECVFQREHRTPRPIGPLETGKASPGSPGMSVYGRQISVCSDWLLRLLPLRCLQPEAAHLQRPSVRLASPSSCLVPHKSCR